MGLKLFFLLLLLLSNVFDVVETLLIFDVWCWLFRGDLVVLEVLI